MRLVISLVVLFALATSNCNPIPARIRIDRAIGKYEEAASKVNLGDDKEKVLSVFLPIQRGLPANAKKPAQKLIKDGTLIEIYFMRTGRDPDGRTTDNEFTPYVFVNNKLTAIGWEAASLVP